MSTFVLYGAAVTLSVIAMLSISALLGEKHREPATAEPYESGIRSTGSARVRFSAQFYLVAMLFVIFDLEAVFLFAWATSIREGGWPAYGAAMLFVAVIVVGLVYEWRQGALEFTRAGKGTTAESRR
jgi:NADH-quinone oxidoreductase subunit A